MQYLDDAEYMYSKYRLKERPNEFYFNKKVAGVQVNMRTVFVHKPRVSYACINGLKKNLPN